MNIEKNDAAKNLMKTASRRLINAAGGVEGSSMICRVSKSNLSDYQNRSKPGYFMPLDVVADLQGDTGCTAVTDALAHLAGGYFVKLPDLHGDKKLEQSLAKVMKETGEVISKAGQALEDGHLSDRERTDLQKEVRDAIGALAETQGLLEGAAG